MKYDTIPEIRTLKPEEIYVRFSRGNENGGFYLLYVDSRTVVKLLDETFGKENWQRIHKTVAGHNHCGISVWDPTKNQWITKEDAGSESTIDPEKGEASSAFKRALVSWGVTELYTKEIKIYIKSDKIPLKKNRNDKWEVDGFDVPVVDFVEYNEDRDITKLIISFNNEEVWRYPRAWKGKATTQTTPKPAVTEPAPTQSQPEPTQSSSPSDDKFPMCTFTTNYESASMTSDMVDEILGYDLEHMIKALEHWKSQYPKLKVSYKNQDIIGQAIVNLGGKRIGTGKNTKYVMDNTVSQTTSNEEEITSEYDDIIDDMPF